MKIQNEIYGVYSFDHHMTFIMEDVYGVTDDDKIVPISTEVKGFYYGEPNDKDIKTFYNNTKISFNE